MKERSSWSPRRAVTPSEPAWRTTRCKGRGGKGVLTIQYDKKRGTLVGALIVDDDDELYAITSGGGVIRTAANQVRKAGRQTKGVRLMNLGEGDTLLAIARNADEPEELAAETTDKQTMPMELRSPSEHSQPAGQ